ncbi:MAG: nickel pincer cofactor biosynthesis protein LarC [Planctomycetaceae bacterium]
MLGRLSVLATDLRDSFVRIAYLDCSTGISGDMTLAALIDAGADFQQIRRGVESLGIPGVRLEVDTVVKGGFRAQQIHIEHPEQHAHRHLSDIRKLIDEAGQITAAQKELATRIFTAVARAEATVHGSTVELVHFHEVGAIDSIVDIVGSAIGWDLLAVEQVVCSRIPTGRGQVKIAHGVCTVPTPGTAELLKGIPLVDVPLDAELTTPTGAAIVASLVDRFGPLPDMVVDAVGYGAGTMEFSDRANMLRLFVGEQTLAADADEVGLLETNLDDVTPEVVGYAKRRLLEAGALDVFSVSAHMKKDRPGIVLTVICRPVDMERLETIVFQETGTLGIRRQRMQRSKQTREICSVQTEWGQVTGKLSRHGSIVGCFVPEFEDCARIAEQQQQSLRTVYRAAESAFSYTEPPRTMVHDHDHDHDSDHDHDHDHDSDQHGTT